MSRDPARSRRCGEDLPALPALPVLPALPIFEAQNEARKSWGSPGFEGKADDGLLSHHLAVAVPSALQGLTAVFGMGTGVAPAR